MLSGKPSNLDLPCEQVDGVGRVQLARTVYNFTDTQDAHVVRKTLKPRPAVRAGGWRGPRAAGAHGVQLHRHAGRACCQENPQT